jgi:hypothetical protein
MFTKKDLHTGMIVELRYGWKGIVFLQHALENTGVLIGDGFTKLNRYGENLLHVAGDTEYDICKVYMPKFFTDTLKMEGDLIWQREEETEADKLRKQIAELQKKVDEMEDGWLSFPEHVPPVEKRYVLASIRAVQEALKIRMSRLVYKENRRGYLKRGLIAVGMTEEEAEEHLRNSSVFPELVDKTRSN